MGAITKLLGGLLGGGSTPKANVQPETDKLAEEEAKAKKARSALLETGQGTGGTPLQPGQVGGRSTLFGN